MICKNNPSMISAQNLCFSYPLRKNKFHLDKYVALQDVSFELFKGETLGILGLNGAGKTTLLRILAGILEPDSGIINFYNHTASMLSIGAGFIPYLTGRENVYLSGLLLGMGKKDIDERIEEIEEFADISSYFDNPVASYSTGMRARLGFSIALQINSDVVLIDEVFGVGDFKFQRKSSKTLRLLIESNKSAVVVSHNQQLISKLCDRALLLRDGRVEHIGPTNETLSFFK